MSAGCKEKGTLGCCGCSPRGERQPCEAAILLLGMYATEGSSHRHLTPTYTAAKMHWLGTTEMPGEGGKSKNWKCAP